jgi:hypothetical protein
LFATPFSALYEKEGAGYLQPLAFFLLARLSRFVFS